jgi:hypothetical protein
VEYSLIEFLIRFILMNLASVIFAWAIADILMKQLNKFKTGNEKQKKRALQCLIFFILSLLTIYAYTVRSLLFQ